MNSNHKAENPYRVGPRQNQDGPAQGKGCLWFQFLVFSPATKPDQLICRDLAPIGLFLPGRYSDLRQNRHPSPPGFSGPKRPLEPPCRQPAMVVPELYRCYQAR